MIVFIQHFPAGTSGGGGARILRRLTEGRDAEVHFICTTFIRPQDMLANESWMPLRCNLGRVDRSRLRSIFSFVDPLLQFFLEKRLKKRLKLLRATCVHVVPHGSDYFPALKAAKSLNIPVVCAVHDDLLYTNVSHPLLKLLENQMRVLWSQSTARFCICEELAVEYSRRYGEKNYSIITDGIDQIVPEDPKLEMSIFDVYFMGLFHNGYRDNLHAFLTGFASFAASSGRINSSIRFRCGSLEGLGCIDWPVEILPFAGQEVVNGEMRNSKILYLPLPFGEKYENFVRYSFSTKLISYLASGRPILYHGPSSSSVSRYLAREGAAIQVNSLDSEDVAKAVRVLLEDVPASRKIARNALAAVSRDFSMGSIRSKFWSKIDELVKSPGVERGLNNNE